MSELNKIKVEDDPVDESLLAAYAKANEVFDEQDAIEEEAARFFGVTVEYARKGAVGRPTPRIENWMRERFKQAGWEYRD